MERVFADATRGGRQPAPGPGADRARRERAPARRRPAARPRARRAGARPARRRDARGPVRGADDARADRLVARRPGRRRALDTRRRSRSRARSGGRISRRARRDELASSAIARLDLDRAMQLVAEALELAEESGNIAALGWALVSQARIDALRGRSTRRRQGSTQARGALRRVRRQLGARRASTTTTAGSSAAAATSRRPSRRFRDAIRILKPLEDRGTLCESQRGLAQVLVSPEEDRRGGALRARGPRDRRAPRQISRATTRMALGIVRAAQGRDEEAEVLLREAVARRRRQPLLLIRRELVDRARAVPARARPDRRGGGRTRPSWPSYDAGARRRLKHGPDRLRRPLVGRLRDHRRGPLEAAERIAQRLRAQRSLAVGEVLRLVPVRVGDVARSGCGTARRARAPRRRSRARPRRPSTSVKAPSVVACMCAKSITGRTQSSARRDLDDVVDRAELADAAHHLDAERDGAVLRTRASRAASRARRRRRRSSAPACARARSRGG